MNDKFLSLLGMARKSGRLSLGHDAAISSVVKNQAKLCIISLEGSDRLKREMAHACNYGGKNIEILNVKYDTLTLSKAIGSKAAVITVNDEGFAKVLKEKYEAENTID
ncbi:MAG: L7Ae/L30e/S12e/Gadd45 family ribosomal protein [Acutalibacteraceae bacterium]